MAKKQFIRHLEFYGFPDQNGYSSYIGGSSIDLSDIIEKNKEQDEEIQGLEGEKADKKDLDELSGTVETLISAQTEFNDEILGAISGITDDINTLKDIDNMYGQQLSALTDGVNDALCGIQNLGDRVDDVVEDLNELSGKVETFSGETAEKFSDVWDELDKKLDKTEAEETYAKIADVPTKDELDTILEDYTTKEYIDSLGHITQEQGDARYAKIETVDALSNRLNDSVTDLNTKIYDISGDVQTLSSTTNTRIGTLETNFETLRGETNRKLNEMSGTVETCNVRVAQNASNIAALQTEVERKANKTEVEALNTRITNLSDIVDTKVGKPEFETYKASVANQFNNMDNKKADKTEIVRLDDRIDATNGRIDQEIIDREANDTLLNNKITNINSEITEINEQDAEQDDRITNLENGLEQEIADRKQGDLDLIGTSADTIDADTIFGAKAFAKDMKRQAIESAKVYTDTQITNLESEFEDEFENIERELTAKADITYVDNSRNELKSELQSEINDAVESETNERLSEEASLWTAVRANTQTIASNTTQIDYNSDRIDAITSWPGTDPNEYDDGGTGILDVLHREFHKFSTTVGAIKDVKIEDGMLIITYITTFGEETISTPLTDIFDADAYYNKEEVNTLLASKADLTTIDDLVDNAPSDYNTLGKIADYLQDNTDNINTIQSNIAANADAIRQNSEAIRENINAINSNSQGIRANTENIATNAEKITQNTNNIAQNTQDIAQNTSDIANNTTAITKNTSDIANNTTAIANNTTAITKNASDIAQNAQDIAAAQNAIEELNNGAAEIETELATKANKSEVDAALATKPSITQMNTALANKVNSTTFDNAMALKADSDYVDTMLREKVSKTAYEAEIASLWAEIERLRNLIEN